MLRVSSALLQKSVKRYVPVMLTEKRSRTWSSTRTAKFLC
jgi:hypothetical protein